MNIDKAQESYNKRMERKRTGKVMQVTMSEENKKGRANYYLSAKYCVKRKKKI